MVFNYITQLEHIQAVMQTSTSLAILNTGLTGTVNTLITKDRIRLGDPKNITNDVDMYPSIYIYLENAEENLSEINMNSGLRTMQTNIGIYCMNYIASDSYSAYKGAVTLMQNAQTIIRSNYNKNTYWDMADMTGADIDGAYKEQGSNQIYQFTAKINMQYKQMFS